MAFDKDDKDEEAKETRIQRPLISRLFARITKGEKAESLQVNSVMRKGVVVLDSGRTVKDAAKAMKKSNIGSIVVLEKGRAVGIVTERDLARKVVAEGRKPTAKIKSVMSSPLRVVSESKNIEEAVLLMKKHGIKRLPVLDRQNRLIGIITETDVTRAVPGLLTLTAELSNIERFEATNDLVGACQNCGNWSESLEYVQGERLCQDCREEEAEKFEQ